MTRLAVKLNSSVNLYNWPLSYYTANNYGSDENYHRYFPDHELPSEGIVTVEGDIASIVLQLQQKKNLLYAGDERHTDIRTALVFEQGGIAGVFQAGVGRAFDEAGFDSHIVDDIIGSSTGAFTGLFLATGYSLIGGRVYQDIVAKKITD